MQRDDLARLREMVESARLVSRYVEHRRRPDLDSDSLLTDAVIRRIELIGEAARLVSEPVRARAATVPWRQIVGARHVLSHEYWRIDLDILWQIVTTQMSPLIAAIEPLLVEAERVGG